MLARQWDAESGIADRFRCRTGSTFLEAPWHAKRIREPYVRVGVLALLLANQTEKDLPAGYGYLDHAYYGYHAMLSAGFLPERRVSCPMDGAYLPQHVKRARREGRMLGQVRDLLIMRKPAKDATYVNGLPHASS